MKLSSDYRRTQRLERGGWNFWIERMSSDSKRYLFVKKHFEGKYLNRNESRTRLYMNMLPTET